MLLIFLQASSHPLTDLVNLNSTPSAGGSLLVDVFSDSPAPASTDVSEENFPRWDNTRSSFVIYTVLLYILYCSTEIKLTSI